MSAARDGEGAGVRVVLRWEWGVRLCARVGCVRGCGAQGAVKAARHPFLREKKSEAREERSCV